MKNYNENNEDIKKGFNKDKLYNNKLFFNIITNSLL